ncbi:MAG: chemotaxis protein CheW [Firmicutes bacterium]|nr:chemotaxis protein CheW [Bacillota bacterium]
MRFLVTYIGSSAFGIRTDEVAQVLPMMAVTPIPDAPAYIMGQLNIRGNFIILADIRERISRKTAPFSYDTRVIVLKKDSFRFGIICDFLEKVIEIDTPDIEPPPKFIAGMDRSLIRGVYRDENKLIVLADLAGLLKEEEIEDIKKLIP